MALLIELSTPLLYIYKENRTSTNLFQLLIIFTPVRVGYLAWLIYYLHHNQLASLLSLQLLSLLYIMSVLWLIQMIRKYTKLRDIELASKVR